jgi:RNA polymerase primary sigma factor
MVIQYDSGALQAYLAAIAQLPRLTPADERAVAQRIRADPDDEEALRTLVEGNLRFVVSCAKRYRGLGVPFLDLIHEGNLGLLEAARRFDPDRNVKFITYAVWWIRQAISHALSGQMRALAVPDKLWRITAVGADVSLSEHDVLDRTAESLVEDGLLHQAVALRVRVALDELDAREREVVELRFGLDRDGEVRTLQEVGALLHLTRERVRQIEADAKRKLRRSKRAEELRSYLN